MDTEYLTNILERGIGDGKQEFGSFFLMRLLGMAGEYSPGRYVVSIKVGPELYNPQGTLHGGVLATALDIAMGHLLQREFGAGATLEMKVQYFAPVKTGVVKCNSSFLKSGRRIFFLQAEAVTGEGEVLAYATSTWKLL